MHAFPCAAGRGYKRTQAGCAPTTSASDLDARIWAIARSLVDCGIYKRIYIDARFPDVPTPVDVGSLIGFGCSVERYLELA
jgi:hypothetical protein